MERMRKWRGEGKTSAEGGQEEVEWSGGVNTEESRWKVEGGGGGGQERKDGWMEWKRGGGAVEGRWRGDTRGRGEPEVKEGGTSGVTLPLSLSLPFLPSPPHLSEPICSNVSHAKYQ